MPIHSKKDLYKNEQYDILIKLINIIGISKNITSIEKGDIEKQEILEKIDLLKDDIIKYFNTGNWYSTRKGDHTQVNFIRKIFKYFDIEGFSIERKKKDENNYYKSFRIYKFIIPENILNDL
jgi:hypothetical protein